MNCTQHVLTGVQAAACGIPVVASADTVVVVGEFDGIALWWSQATTGTLASRLNASYGSTDWRAGQSLPSLSLPSLPFSHALSIVGQTNVTIANLAFRNSGTAITLQGCSNVRVAGCDFRGVFLGVYALSCTGGIVVEDCIGVNAKGAGSHFVQLDKCSGAGNIIRRNRFDNVSDLSSCEDHISIYKSNGTAASPIQVVDNVLRGGGPSTSGSGIIAGDGGGSHITVARNRLINPGQVGIGIAGGSNIIVEDNDAYGAQSAWSNVAFYAWDQSGLGVSNLTVRRNRADWRNSAGTRNGWSLNANAAAATTLDSNQWSATLDPAALWAT